MVERPVERLLDTIVANARGRAAQFIAVDTDRTRFWIDGEWIEDAELPPPLGDHLVRRLGVLIGKLAPAREQSVMGRVELAAAYLLVRIDRDDNDRLRAIIEMVDATEFRRRAQPRPPSQHPYRNHVQTPRRDAR